MVWYPSVGDIVTINANALDLTADKHPYKVIKARIGIEKIIDNVKAEEEKGATYQAAVLMKELVKYHGFDSANHRTAYSVAKAFLLRNGRHLQVSNFEAGHSFIKAVRGRDIQHIHDVDRTWRAKRIQTRRSSES